MSPIDDRSGSFNDPGGTMGAHDESYNDWTGAIDPVDLATASRIANRVTAATPIPAPGFRGNLARHLTGAEAGRVRLKGMPPLEQARRWVVGLAGSGGMLLSVAVLGILGLGPLSA